MRVYEVPETVSGIYLLIKEGRVVYVGQSVDIHRRVLAHKNEKSFDSYQVIPAPEPLLDDLETLLVLAYNPPYNGCIPRSDMWASLDVITHRVDTDKRSIRKAIEAQGIVDVQGYYRVKDVLEAIEDD